MKRYYDIELVDKIKSCKISYLADYFTITENAYLKVFSKEYGDIIEDISDMTLTVTELEVPEYYDCLLDEE